MKEGEEIKVFFILLVGIKLLIFIIFNLLVLFVRVQYVENMNTYVYYSFVFKGFK